jgi:flagellar biosynthesis protein FliR
MSFDHLLPWLLSIALLTVRLTVAVALSPALTAFGIPAIVRILLTVALALLTFANREAVPAAAVWAGDPAQLVLPMLAEISIGAFLGLGVHLVLAAFALAGRVLDVQVGIAIGSLFDPVTRSSSNVLGSLATLVGVTLFMVTEAHLQLARLLAQSLDVLPLGAWPELSDPLQPLLAAGSMFTLGLVLAAPIVMALLLTDVVVAVVSRNMPQMNVLVLVVPIKVLIGYLVLACTLRNWATLLQQGFGYMVERLGVH